MKLEIGKRYVRRDGGTETITHKHTLTPIMHPFISRSTKSFREDGVYIDSETESAYDLMGVAENQDLSQLDIDVPAQIETVRNDSPVPDPISLLPQVEQDSELELEIGKRYVRRDGRIETITESIPGNPFFKFRAESGYAYSKDGRLYVGGGRPSDGDLVSGYVGGVTPEKLFKYHVTFVLVPDQNRISTDPAIFDHALLQGPVLTEKSLNELERGILEAARNKHGLEANVKILGIIKLED